MSISLPVNEFDNLPGSFLREGGLRAQRGSSPASRGRSANPRTANPRTAPQPRTVPAPCRPWGSSPSGSSWCWSPQAASKVRAGSPPAAPCPGKLRHGERAGEAAGTGGTPGRVFWEWEKRLRNGKNPFRELTGSLLVSPGSGGAERSSALQVRRRQSGSDLSPQHRAL